MKDKVTTNRIRVEIVKALKNGEFVSGENLANALSLSRSAISNHVKALCALGLDVFSVKGRGYCLPQPISMLEKSEITTILNSSSASEYIQVHNIVTSTNDIIKQRLSELKNGAVCVAEAQTAGRGRRGRQWVSPFGASVYMTMLWRFESGYQSMAGLSLLVGIAVNRTIASMGYNGCQLKWPNDVYANNKKLCGILIEVEGQVGASTDAIIGIGINVNLPTCIDKIDQPYIDLSQVLGQSVDRNLVTATLIQHLWDMLPIFESEGLIPFLSEWEIADLYYMKAIVLQSGKQQVQGICRGIDKSGALLMEVNGQVRAFHGGEISVRQC